MFSLLCISNSVYRGKGCAWQERGMYGRAGVCDKGCMQGVAMGDPEFPPGADANSPGRHQHTILPKNLMKTNEI